MTRFRTKAASLFALAAVLTTAVPAQAGDAVAAPPVGRVSDFSLNDQTGATRTLAEWKEHPVLVVVFLGVECPLARLYGRRLAELDRQYRDRGVQFVGINANQQDTLQELAGYATKFGVEFPLLKDPGAKVADQCGATRTPEAFVLEEYRTIRYQARIDDQHGAGAARKKATRHDLAGAIDALLAGAPIEMAKTEAVGCLIGRRAASRGDSSAAGAVTYATHIAPILNNRCVSCHREGQIGPFTLTDYADVAAWSDMCLEVIDQGRMPPWSANPAHGEFVNDARMSAEEKELFRRGVEAGVPEGDPAETPPPRQFVDGWQIPKPDVVFTMPEEYDVPAAGTVPYKYFFFDPHFTEDKWVRAAEARPGNYEVVHHLILFYIPPGQDKPRPEDPLFNAVAAFAPGMPAITGPENYAVRIPAGSRLGFQVHYTPNGAPQKDRSEAGLVFSDPAHVEKEVRVQAALNVKFLIPPGHPDYVVHAQKKLSRDAMLYTLTPHMHYRGKSFRFTAVYPDGGEEILLDVPRYDFNWQIIYQLKTPKRLPAGTVVKLDAHFDNSADNPLNPDPGQTVYWGDQTWDEMMLGSMTLSQADQDLRMGPPRVEAVRSASQDDDGEYRVTFHYRPVAGDPNLPQSLDAVHLAGTFNDWKTDDRKLDGPDANGDYSTELRLPAGRYEYKFILNGDLWKTDPGSREVTREYGNSVLVVK
jgi:peroxiredoxin